MLLEKLKKRREINLEVKRYLKQVVDESTDELKAVVQDSDGSYLFTGKFDNSIVSYVISPKAFYAVCKDIDDIKDVKVKIDAFIVQQYYVANLKKEEKEL